jgi:hypothetical protein
MPGYHDSTGLYRQTEQAFVRVALGSFWLAAGTALAAFADGASATPGFAVDNSEAVGIRWNNHAAPSAIFTSIPMPNDRKPGSDMTLHVIASKSGATVGDAVTFTVAAFNNAVGALHDADANFGGASSAMVGDATAKTVQRVTRTLAAADLADAYSAMSLSLKPTDGTLGTDDVTVHEILIEYTKLVTSV